MKLVFIHGSAGSKNNFKYLIQELQEFDCLAFDLIGFGKEKKPKIKYDVKTFLEFIEKKVNVKEKMVVVGHSLGAILAKELALQYPKSVEKVFLINYPMNKEAVKKHWLSGMFLRENVISKLHSTRILGKRLLPGGKTKRSLITSRVLWMICLLRRGAICLLKLLRAMQLVWILVFTIWKTDRG